MKAPPKREKPAPAPSPIEKELESSRDRFVGIVLGIVLGRFSAFYAAIFLGIGGLVLAVAWHMGPNKYLQARQFPTLTATAPARIVDRWMAIEFDPSKMGEYRDWRPFARASACIVVEYDGGWGSAQRRAFCGTRLPFYDHYTLHDVKEVSPGVPFTWSRDDHGFAVPELRVSKAAFDFLSKVPAGTPADADPVEHTDLGRLRALFERPVDNAIAGWSAQDPEIMVSVDPARPAEAWPTSLVTDPKRLAPDWFGAIAGGIMGLVFWYAGVRILAGNHRWPLIAIGGALPLLLLPWFTDAVPRAVRSMNDGAGQVIEDMMGTVDGVDRFAAMAPADATLAQGQRIVLAPAASRYADTFGTLALAPPSVRPADADAALLALADAVAARVRAEDEDTRVALFTRLARDKSLDRPRAGYAFLRAAREAYTAPASSPQLREAAYRFLDVWVTQPVEEPWPEHLGFGARVELLRELREIPPPNDIAIRAGWIVDRAQARPAAGK